MLVVQAPAPLLRSRFYNQPMEPLVIAGRAFQSRLIVGTGKYKDGAETQRAIEASGAEMVTVAVRRVNLDRSRESLLDFIDPRRYFLLPNTAGCYTADEAIRAARLGREVGLSDWVKIEVIGDQRTLYPDVQATLEATTVLVKEGFTVLPYTTDDIVFARRLIDAGAAAVMPLGAPIGSGLGLQNTANIQILRELITEVPLIIDAGVGTASDAALAMELGADAVLVNSCIAPCRQSRADGRSHAAWCTRRTSGVRCRAHATRKLYATASSPVEGVSQLAPNLGIVRNFLVSEARPGAPAAQPGNECAQDDQLYTRPRAPHAPSCKLQPCVFSALIAAPSAPAMASSRWWKKNETSRLVPLAYRRHRSRRRRTSFPTGLLASLPNCSRCSNCISLTRSRWKKCFTP